MTIYEHLCQLTVEQRVGRIGYADGCLVALHKFDPSEVAFLSCTTWACPDYLAPQIGFAFECKNPGTVDRECCAKCALAFLRMQWPNTGRCRYVPHD